jgi:hypothetical protein
MSVKIRIVRTVVENYRLSHNWAATCWPQCMRVRRHEILLAKYSKYPNKLELQTSYWEPRMR